MFNKTAKPKDHMLNKRAKRINQMFNQRTKRKTYEELERMAAERAMLEQRIENAKKELAMMDKEEKKLHFLDHAALSAMNGKRRAKKYWAECKRLGRPIPPPPGFDVDDDKEYFFSLNID